MLAGRRRGAALATTVALLALPTAPEAQSVGSAARAAQHLVAYERPATRKSLAAAARRAMRRDGFDRVVTRCGALRETRLDCTVRARDGGVTWTGTAVVLLRGKRALTSYLVESA